MVERRTPLFFVAALAFHLAVLLALPRVRRAPVSPPQDLTFFEIEATGTSAPIEHGGTGVATVAVASRNGSYATQTRGRETSAVVIPDVQPSASAVTSAMPQSLFLSNPAAIGLSGPGSYRIDVAKQPLPPPDDSARLADTVQHAIMDPIHERERLNGTLADGPVVVALESSTRQLPGSPFEGRAVFAIRIDELGLVVSAQVVESSSDRRAWDEVAAHTFNALAQKRLRIPPGSKGVAMRVEITSKVVLPSGSRVPITAQLGGTPDPTSPSLPIVSGGFDLSDIGAHPQRVVGARVLSENAL
jgi:hypothetical protein